MLDALPDASVPTGNRGYDADWLRPPLRTRGTRSCIPGRAGPTAHRHGKKIYRDCQRVAIMFGRLKEWRRIHPL